MEQTTDCRTIALAEEMCLLDDALDEIRTVCCEAGALETRFVLRRLVAGRIDGLTYGRSVRACACLFGSIVQARGQNPGALRDVPSEVLGRPLTAWEDRQVELFFTLIRRGDRPETSKHGPL